MTAPEIAGGAAPGLFRTGVKREIVSNLSLIHIYSCLIVMAEYLDMPELLEHVRRNLNMIEAYFEPDMSVFTGNSTRQDNGTDVYADI